MTIKMGRYKIYGGAGCGKTYHLMQQLEELIDENIDIQSISMMTLTRAARREFIERAMKLTNENEKKLRWFGTMHQLAWRMLGLDFKTHILTKKKKRIYEDSCSEHKRHMLSSLQKVNDVRRNCMQPNTNDGLLKTRHLTGLDFIYRNEFGKWEPLRMNDIIEFGDDWYSFLDVEDLYDYTKMIVDMQQSLVDGDLTTPFDYMLVDEFQDFSPLQHALYEQMASQVIAVWFCGDDLQVIYRFAGATPHYLLNDPSTPPDLVLPKTYRYGANILGNSLKYVEHLKVKKDRVIEPADHEDRVYELNGDSWLRHLYSDDSTTVYLARTKRQVHTIATELDERGIMYGLLGHDNSRLETLISNYNTISLLERGENVLIDDVKVLIKSLPVAPDIQSGQIDLFGNKAIKKMQLLKRGIKTHIDDGEYSDYANKEFYDQDEFAQTFLANWSWGDIDLFDHLEGMNEFIHEKGIQFPKPVDVKITHHIGTIHKFKGNEADNVFLFTQLPYPIDQRVYESSDSMDDERRVFYVGATRPRYNLYEISDYFSDFYGNSMMNVGEIL